jgi:hypothetical protein
LFYSLRFFYSFLFFFTSFSLTLLLWTYLYFNKVNEKNFVCKEYRDLRFRLNLLDERLEHMDIALRYSRIDYLRYYYGLSH